MSAAATLTSDPDAPTPATAWRYRQQARRLRHHFRHDASKLHLSLKALAAKEDASRPWKPMERPGQIRQHVEVRVRSQPGVTRSSGRAELPPAPLIIDVGATAAALDEPREAVRQFSVLVRDALSEGILRHSLRESLLRQAATLGLGQFEATLVLATVEHRQTGTERRRDAPRVRNVIPTVLITGIFLTLEALSLFAASTWVK
jgi:hypothetical protein